MKPEDKIETEKLTLKESIESATMAAESIVDTPIDHAHSNNLESECEDGISDEEDFPDLGGEYKVLQILGSGGMSTVYKAMNVQTGSIVAIKVISALLAKDKATLKRFEKESEALINLDDPELINIYGSSLTADGAPYLVMEYIEGESLAELLSREKIDPQRALSLSIEICRLLTRAHKHSIIHRDIKPSNIMVTNLAIDETDKPIQGLGKIEQVRIVDFGIARMVDSTTGNTTSLTQTGAIFGTPKYMSPEQCKTNQEVDHRADIYSFGCLMYELLTGKPPFSGDNPVQVAIQHLNDPPEPFAKKSKDKTLRRLEPIVLKCLEKDKQDRYQSTDQLLKDLERVKRGGTAAVLWNPFRSTLMRAPRPSEVTETEIGALWTVFLMTASWIALGAGTLTGPEFRDSLSSSAQLMESTMIGFFSFYTFLASIYILRFLSRQYRFLRNNNWKMKTKDFWFMQTGVVSCMIAVSNSALFSLMLLALVDGVKGSLPFTILTSTVGSIFIVLVLLYPITCLHVPFTEKLKWMNQEISIKQSALQLLSLILVATAAFVICCFARPQVAAGVLNYSATAVTPTETKPLARALYQASMKLDSEGKFAPAAIANLDYMSKDYKSALGVLNDAVASNPNYAPFLLHRAQVHEKLHNVKASFDDLNTVVAMKEKAQKEQDKRFAEEKKREKGKSTEDKVEVSNADPNNVWMISMDDLLSLRAKLHTDQNRYDDAIKDYAEAIQVNPKNAAMFRNRGSIYLAKKDYKQAIDDLYKALIAGGDELDYLRLATAYELQGNSESAKEYYTLMTKNSLDSMTKAIAFKKLNQLDEYEAIINPKNENGGVFSAEPLKSKAEIAKELFDENLHIPLSWSD